MKKYISLILLLAISIVVKAQDSQVNSDCFTNPPDFNKLSYDEANTVVDSEDDLIGRGIKKICPEYITNLVNQIRNGALNSDNKTLAIYLLGELHPDDTNSIEVLIENIDFKATKFDHILKTRISIKRWGSYPAEEALIKIGRPVVDPILNHLPTENSELRRQLMCDVLKQVLRHK
ncbi:MAG: hypothetical protein ACREDS_00530 [Limisphaerales bacterium]